jgi:dienelactone hydrolase
MVTQTPVSFASGGVEHSGRLILPDDAGQALPGVVLAQGFGQTMDLFLPHAGRLAQAGLAALVFDYSGFGESGGRWRQTVDIAAQQDDIRAAVAFARAHDSIDPDRIALWGNSLGGGHVITVAADDPRIAAVVSQIPFNGFPSQVEGRTAWQSTRLLLAILYDVARRQLGMPRHLIKLVGVPGEVAITTTPEAQQRIRSLEGTSTSWRNEVAPAGLLQMMRYRPSDDAHRVRVPVLVTVAEDDREAPVEQSRLIADEAPQGRLRSYPGGHIDFYSDENLRARVLDDQAGFLRAVLLPEPAQST